MSVVSFCDILLLLHQVTLKLWFVCSFNRIGSVIVSVLPSSGVDRGFES